MELPPILLWRIRNLAAGMNASDCGRVAMRPQYPKGPQRRGANLPQAGRAPPGGLDELQFRWYGISHVSSLYASLLKPQSAEIKTQSASPAGGAHRPTYLKLPRLSRSADTPQSDSDPIPCTPAALAKRA